ncbi:TraB/GumN family protein [Enterococcus wangshanyuanii]|uniref:Conjugal transfer protein TraB n=1 Tax=Enterococcus wangshanyuanii TaxID=2005703 RepID=A0ABQ1PVX8_9ENTE|nr:TraB/GumN family protein [Enterococcus wangshanyuanii]GGD05477.1 conjugal transfer protein TraB [Enterococcus wangshanyuanii]
MENVVNIFDEEKQIILIGTNHVEQSSVELVQQIIEQEQPDTVCIELDEKRFEKYTQPKMWAEMDIIKVIKSGKLPVLFFEVLYSAFQRKLASNVGTKAGGEMSQAITSANKIDAKIELIDRDSQITFKRLWRNLSFWQKPKLFGAFGNEFDMAEQDNLADLLESENFENVFVNIREKFPSVYKDMISDRDQYMASRLTDSKGKKIVAVVGRAHLEGIKNNFGNRINISELNTIPPKRLSSKVLEWVFPMLIIALLGVSFLSGTTVGIQQLIRWFMWNGGLAALFTLLALGHPLTILTALITAPIGALSPVLSVGVFTAIVEATVRKPRVNDFLKVQDDLKKISTVYKNRVLRVILVFFFANIGGAIGNIVGGLDIIKSLLN